jgi:outer membrane protein assembly factor BamB
MRPRTGGAFRWVVLVMALLLARTEGQAETFPLLTNRWVVRTGVITASSPAVAKDGTIYVGTFEHQLWAVNANGTRKWIFKAGSEIWSSPAVADDGTVVFGCRDRNLYALSSDGRQKWAFKTGAWVDSSPAIGDGGTVYFGSWDKNFYALNTNGNRLWTFSTGGPIVSSAAIGVDGTIYFGSHDRKLYALAPNGQKKWEFATGGSILSSPALNTNICLYFTSVDGSFYALSFDGQLLWKLKTGGISDSSPVIGLDGRVYVGVNQAMWAISEDGKHTPWSWGAGLVEATPVALADRSVCFNSYYGPPTAVGQDNKIKWTSEVEFHGHASVGIGPDGTLYVNCHQAGLYALEGAAPLAASPWPKFRGNARNTGNVKDVGK